MGDITLINADQRWGTTVDGKFTVIDDVAIEFSVMGLYKFVEQPEYCTHAYCNYERGKPKPKCVYESWRKLTREELSSPTLKNIFAQVFVQFIHEHDRRSARTMFDYGNEKFIKYEVQDGGNDRLVPITTWKLDVLNQLGNLSTLVDGIKKRL